MQRSLYLENANTQIMHVHCFSRRLLGLLKSTSGDIVCGGDSNEATLYISPTVISNVSPDDKIMQVSYTTCYLRKYTFSGLCVIALTGGDLWSSITHYHGGKL